MKTKAYPWHELGIIGGPADRKPNGITGFPADLRPTDELANAPMPVCRTPIPSKGKQRIWAVSYRKRSIETQIAVSADKRREVHGAKSALPEVKCPLHGSEMNISAHFGHRGNQWEKAGAHTAEAVSGREPGTFADGVRGLVERE